MRAILLGINSTNFRINCEESHEFDQKSASPVVLILGNTPPLVNMAPESSNERTPLHISDQSYGSLESTSKMQAAQTMEATKATVQADAQCQNPDGSENGDRPPTDALSPDWDVRENVDNPLNWSPLWKYGIIALVSFIELLTSVYKLPCRNRSI